MLTSFNNSRISKIVPNIPPSLLHQIDKLELGKAYQGNIVNLALIRTGHTTKT